MRKLLILSVIAFSSCQKDYTCYCEEIQNGVPQTKYAVFDYRSKGSYNPQKDECLNYAKEQRPAKTAGKQDFVFECHGVPK